MIGGQRVLALIPARGGSKGLPGKNIMRVKERPLIAWTAEAARGSRYVDQVVLSTDDEAIMAVGLQWGCEVPFRRPAALATDETPSIEVVMHALEALPEFGFVVLLQPTSPLRCAADIDAAVEMMIAAGAPACVSVAEVEQNPYWMYRLAEKGSLRPLLDPPPGEITRRQDLPAVYALNGAIYISEVAWLLRAMTFVTDETVAYVMPRSRSLDVDTQADLEAFRLAVNEDAHA